MVAGVSRIIFFSLLQAFACFIPVVAQPAGWTQADAFDNRYFIENKGQFDFLNGYDSANVFYAIKGNGVYILFTKTGIIYRFSEVKYTERKKGTNSNEPDERTENLQIQYKYVCMKWASANPDVRIETSEKTDYYITCADPKNPNSPGYVAGAYKRLRYKNLYPGIDVDYFFIDRRDGFEYNMILHPGADPGKVSQEYFRVGMLKTDSTGELNISAGNTFITDSKPIDANGKYEIGYKVDGNRISFNGLPAGKIKETTLIDPFTVVPGFANSQKGYDVDYDYRGNVYVYGGAENGTSAFELIKLDSTGKILWKHLSFPAGMPVFYYGDFTINRCSGSVYISEGVNNAQARIEKLKSDGTIQTIYPGNSTYDEIWRIQLQDCQNNILMGNQGRILGANQISMMDTLFGAFNSYNILPISGGGTAGNDVIAVCQDKTGNYFVHFVQSIPPVYNNYIVSGKLTNPIPLKFTFKSNHRFIELGSVKYNYRLPSGSFANGYNGLCVNNNYIYSYDGAALRQWDKSTTALQRDYKISATDTFRWGGLDVDSCNVLFAGVEKTIQVFDVNLVKINTVYLKDTVYDLRIYKDKLYACGKGFVSQLNIPLPDCIPDSIITTSSLEVPNVFSPNGDNVNDQFILKMKGIQSLELRIYNRWGLIVSEIIDPAVSWDGKNKQGKPVPDGTYYYVIKAEGVDGKKYDLNGFLMLLR